METQEKKLCPNCKTGLESLKLDAIAPFCPYIECYKQESACEMYVPLDTNTKKSEKE